MRYFIVAWFLFFLPLILTGQNLLTNPGFESGVYGWSSFWSRDGKGSAVIITDTVHSGNNALHILYDGSQDWSFSSNTAYSASPGDLVEISAWVLADSIHSDAQFSVELLDSNNNVFSWVYGSCAFTKDSTSYSQFSKKFIIPANTRKILPRLVGSNYCDIFVDDLSVVIDSNIIIPDKQIILDNDTLQVGISYPSMIISTYNKLSHKTYITEPLNEYSVTSVDTTIKNRLLINATQILTDAAYTFTFTLLGNTFTLNIGCDTAQSMDETLQFPGSIKGNSGEYLVIPRGTGLLWPIDQTYPFYTYQMSEWKSTMAFIGVTDMSSGYMIVSEDPWDTEVLLQKNGSEPTISPALLHHASKGKFGYARTTHYVFVQSGYAEMCQWYKKYAGEKGYRKSFDEKVLDNPNVNRLKGALDFWVINMNIGKIDIDNFIRFGIDKAIISLNGWENNISDLIDYINEKGLLSSRYDIYTDVYPPDVFPDVPGYRREGYPEDLIVQSDGSYQKGWVSYIAGTPFQGYIACSATHAAYADSVISKELLTRKYNCRFIDVELASGLKECYSTVHPVTRKTDALARIELLDTVKNKFSLVTGDEEARDFAFPVVDYGEGTMTILPQVNAGYDWANPVDTIGSYYAQFNVNPAIRIPLHGLIYHDVHVPTWYTGDGVSKVPAYWDDKDLFNILYASMPLFMPPGRTYWNNNLEKYLTSYHLISSITREAGFEEMTKHAFLSADKLVQQTEFANNWKITANYKNKPFIYGSVNIAPKGFYASDGGQYEVFKLWDSNSPLAVAYTNNRMFINPYSDIKIYKGVKTEGSVFLRNDSDKVHAAFIGTQTTISIKPSSMPWKMGHAYSELTNKLLTYTYDGNGWFIFKRPQGESFIYFIHDSLIVSVNDLKQNIPEIEFYPNPAQNILHFKLTNSQSQQTSIILTNMLGQPVKELLNSYVPAGKNEFVFDLTGIEKGIYLLVFESDNSIITNRILIQ